MSMKIFAMMDGLGLSVQLKLGYETDVDPTEALGYIRKLRVSIKGHLTQLTLLSTRLTLMGLVANVQSFS